MTDEELAALVREHGGAMFRAARSVTDSDAQAEDAVGRAVLTAFEKRSSLRDERKARPWLVKIAVNCALEDRRRQGRLTSLEDLPGDLPAPETGETFSALREAVSALPEPYRASVTLHYYEGFSTREIAALLGLRRGTVLSRLSRAREMLKKMLEEEE